MLTAALREPHPKKLPQAHKQKGKSSGKRTDFETLGVAWERDGGGLYIKLHGQQIIESGFSAFPITNDTSGDVSLGLPFLKTQRTQKMENQYCELEWNGILISLDYQYKRWSIIDHITLRNIDPPNAPLPTTETGIVPIISTPKKCNHITSTPNNM